MGTDIIMDAGSEQLCKSYGIPVSLGLKPLIAGPFRSWVIKERPI